MNDAFCALPFVHLFSEHEGPYRLCCHTGIQRIDPNHQWNMKDDLPFEFFDSPIMDNVRKKMINGEKLKECERCYKIEKHGGNSPRQVYNKRYPFESLFPGKERCLDVKLSIFGNYCNLSCAMCQPVHSSERIKEIASLVKDPYFNTNPREDMKWDWRRGHKKYQHNYARFKELMQNCLDNIHRIENLVFSTDGEPLLNPRVIEFLDLIPNKDAEQVNIHFTTNLSDISLLWKIKDKFKKVTLSASCDHVKEKYNWIRKGADWDNFAINFMEARSMISNVRPTITVLNINDLDEIESVFKKELNMDIFKLPINGHDNYSIADKPILMNPSLHPHSKNVIHNIKDKNNFTRLKAELTYNFNEKSDEVRMDILKFLTIPYLEKLSETRGNFRKLWPELDIL